METMLVLFREATSSKKHLGMDNQKLYRIAFDFPLDYMRDHTAEFSIETSIPTNKTDFSKWIRKARPIASVFRDLFIDRKNKGYIVEAMAQGIEGLAQDNSKNQEDCLEKLNRTWRSLEDWFYDYPYLINKAYGGNIHKNIANTLYLCAMELASDTTDEADRREEYLYAMFSDDYEEYMMHITPLAYLNKYRFGPLMKLADKGNVIAAQELGDMYYYGTELYYDKNTSKAIINKSPEKAYHYYCLAAEKGYPFSIWAQADMLFNMTAPEGQMDIIAKIELNRLTSDDKALRSKKELVRHYALTLFKKAYKIWIKCAPAYNSTGVYYEERAKELSELAGETVSAGQRDNLLIAANQNLINSIRYYLISYELGLEFSRNRLIRLHEKNASFLKSVMLKGYKDERGILRKITNYDYYIKKLYEECDKNNAYGQNRLGLYYMDHGEREKAKAAFERAAFLGEKWGQENLAKYFNE